MVISYVWYKISTTLQVLHFHHQLLGYLTILSEGHAFGAIFGKLVVVAGLFSFLMIYFAILTGMQQINILNLNVFFPMVFVRLVSYICSDFPWFMFFFNRCVKFALNDELVGRDGS